jgi:hypothetical protein
MRVMKKTNEENINDPHKIMKLAEEK